MQVLTAEENTYSKKILVSPSQLFQELPPKNVFFKYWIKLHSSHLFKTQKEAQS